MRKKSRPDATPIAAKAPGVVMGRFGAPHGVRGEIRLKSYTAEPMAIADYGPLDGADGHEYRLTSARAAAGASPDMLVVRVHGITDRDGAAILNGVDLSVPRDRLPKTEADDFYHADLIGLAAEAVDGTPIGRVSAILDHGAGDLLEIDTDGGPSILVPFTREIVPIVDIEAGRIVIDPPAGLLDAAPDEEGDD